METTYKKIVPEKVFLPILYTEPTEADLWMGRVPNKWGNLDSGNDFIDLFAGILRHYGKRSTAFYAEKMGVDAKQFYATIQVLTGLTVSDWEVYFVIHATDELMDSGQRITQFHKRLGFDDIRNFSHYYKKHKGMRPTHAAEKRRRRR